MAFEYLTGTNSRNLISMVNPERCIDGDFDTNGVATATGVGGSFGVPDYSGVPAWDAPSHQAEYTSLRLYVLMLTSGFDATMSWQLDYDIGGGDPATEWRAKSSENVGKVSYYQEIANPTTQTINDIVGKLTVTQEAGPPAEWTVGLYEMYLRGEYPSASGGNMMLLGVK